MTMSTSSFSPTLCRFVAALVLALTCSTHTGCATPAEKKQGMADAALKDFRLSLDTLDSRVAASERAMDRLQSPRTYDVQSAYMEFMSEYFNVSADAAAVNERAEVMRASGVEYFLAAEAEAASGHDPNAAGAVARRRADSKLAYDTLQDRLVALRDQYRVYRGQLNAIYKSLNRNVTAERVAAARPQLATAAGQAKTVREAIAATKGQADKLSASALPGK